MKRLNEVVDEVKFIVVHVSGHYECRRTPALVVKFLRVPERDQCVPLPVDEKGRTAHFGDVVDVPEAIADHIL